ncbi:MAG: patatin-like phospholipase family protein [Ruminococcus sp.]|nr:patatin-like phospholipase family protein [Ruminococcus sp.]
MTGGIGLVLSGGGAKGGYEAGVYKALEEMGITASLTAFSGTSVGALNAVLFDCMGAAAADIWQSLRITDMMAPDISRIARTLKSLVSDEPSQTDPSEVKLTDPNAVIKYLTLDSATLYSDGLPFSQERISGLIDRYVDFGQLSRKIFVTCVRRHGGVYAGMTSETFRLNSVLYDNEQKKQMVLASAALPGVYCGADGVKIKGMEDSFFDGGWGSKGENTPISPLYTRGFRRIIAVHLRHDPDLSVQSAYPDAEIINIIPSAALGGLLTGTLNLTPDKVRRDIERGYRDTLALEFELLSMIK